MLLNTIVEQMKFLNASRRMYSKTREDVNKVQSSSLLFYSGNIYSQQGQDGILREIFYRIGLVKGTFVEFGAWDGLYLSNCRYLFELDWSGVFIEASQNKYARLKKNYARYKDIICINSYVDFKGTNSIDSLLKKYDIHEINFLSIDIDGLDLNILENLSIKPEVILIEGGFSWSPFLNKRVPDSVAQKNLQQPLSIVFDVAYSKGYLPVCFMQDTYLVRNEFKNMFDKINKSPENLYRDAFYFMGEKHRNQLLRFRELNHVIHEIEKEEGVHYIL